MEGSMESSASVTPFQEVVHGLLQSNCFAILKNLSDLTSRFVFYAQQMQSRFQDNQRRLMRQMIVKMYTF